MSPKKHDDDDDDDDDDESEDQWIANELVDRLLANGVAAYVNEDLCEEDDDDDYLLLLSHFDHEESESIVVMKNLEVKHTTNGECMDSISNHSFFDLNVGDLDAAALKLKELAIAWMVSNESYKLIKEILNDPNVSLEEHERMFRIGKLMRE